MQSDLTENEPDFFQDLAISKDLVLFWPKILWNQA